MSNKVKKMCRLCLKILGNNSFERIEKIVRDKLDALFIILSPNITGPSVICKNCAKDLQKSFDFKSKCLCMEDMIFSDVTRNNKLDLKEIYFKVNDNVKKSAISKAQAICRLCVKLTERQSFTSLKDMKGNRDDIVETLQNHLSKVNLNATEEPGFCVSCIESLQFFSTFIANCLKSEKEFLKSVETEHSANKERSTSIKAVKAVKAKTKCIRTETGITKEADNGESSNLLGSQGNASNANTNKGGRNDERDVESFMEVDESFGTKKKEIHIKPERSNRGSSESSSLRNLRKLKRSPPNTTLFKCYHCSYSTVNSSHLKRHLLVHRDPSQLNMHKCEKCSFESKYEGNLRKHMQLHLDPSEMIIYKCSVCTFRSKRIEVYRRHRRYHANPSQFRVFQCSECNFKTLAKTSFEYHVLNHKTPAEVTMIKCDVCDFKSRHSNAVKVHMLKHKDIVARFECSICDFKTKTNYQLTNHMITHKDPSELKMFHCNVCAYQTKYKYALKSHMLIHKSPSEVTMYKCDWCTYESRYKNVVKNHMSTHKKR